MRKKPPKLPTREEIEERCATIRKEWTPEERIKRAGGKNLVTGPRAFRHPRKTR